MVPPQINCESQTYNFKKRKNILRLYFIGFTLLTLLSLGACGGEDPVGQNNQNNQEENNEEPDNNNEAFDHKQQIGQAANFLLSAAQYEALVVEVQYMENFAPTQTAVNNLVSFLDGSLHKPKGIDVVWTQIPSGGLTTYDINNIREIEDQHRTQFTQNDTIAIYFLFLDGDYAENEGDAKVLGVAHRNTSMTIFEKTIQDLSGGIGEPSTDKLESTVINHELGHILGLVNIGTPMQTDHQDEANGNHCDNSDCLMNWVAETGNVVDNLLGLGPVPQLDQNCMDDLQANGGK